MKTPLKAFILATLCASSLSLASANEENRGVYLGLSGGLFIHDDWRRISDNVSGILGSTSDSRTNSTVAFGATVGYRFNKNFAMEAAYVHADGNAEIRHDLDPDGPSGFAVDKTEHAGISLLAIAPITRNFEAYARLGVAHWKEEQTLTDPSLSFGPTAVIKFEEQGNDLIYGLGLSYALSEKLVGIADFQRLKKKCCGGNMPNDQYMFGLRYGFY